MRWEEPHHPGPGLQLAGTVTHFPPLCNTTTQCKRICTTSWLRVLSSGVAQKLMLSEELMLVEAPT
jgi:hypothetical protein